MYRVNVFANEKDGTKSLLTPFELQKQFDSISAETEEDEFSVNPGVFTTLDRNTWAEVIYYIFIGYLLNNYFLVYFYTDNPISLLTISTIYSRFAL